MSRLTFADVEAHLEQAAKILEEAAVFGANAYANGGLGQDRPIVAKHFTPGNQARYNWAPLSPSYAARKAAGLVHGAHGYHYLVPKEKAEVDAIIKTRAQARKVLGKNIDGEGTDDASYRTEQAKVDREYVNSVISYHARGRKGSALDKTQTKARHGSFSPIQSAATTLPMLVLTGALKEAVSVFKHQIIRTGDAAVIIFEVPQYGLYHHEGTAKMPKRSPVEPNAEDVAEVGEAMKRYLDAQIGTGGSVPVSGTSIPGKARTVNPFGGT